jgi:DNA-binding PadR family transcriptional regulator
MHKKRGLRMWILSMLATSPRNGVEIMQEIETMTHGWWRPSPGSVYPLLEQLTNDRLVRKREDGRYELTDKASEALQWSFGPPFRKAQTLEDMINEISGYVSYFEELSRADQSKAAPYFNQLKTLADRLAALTGAGKA